MAIVATATILFLLTSISVAGPTTTTPPSLSPLDVLIAFKHAITSDPIHALATWADNSTSISNNNSSTGSSDYCAWEGIFCHPNSSRLTAISLPSKLLAGSITPMLAYLPHLSYLDLSYNNLSGFIPPELGLCVSLSQLSLDQNFLIGSLPPSFANLTRLKILSLSHNLFNGTIPPLVLPRLSNLTLSFNFLSGYIPPELTQCSSLRILDMGNNDLNGSLPLEFGNLTRLVYVDLSANQFHGFLPESVANCSRLQHLNLYNNTISGTIPASWGLGLKNLLFLSLGINNGSGEIPMELKFLSKLQYIELGGNHFSGKILTLLMNSTDMSIIDLWGNSFSGILPPDLGAVLSKLTVLSLIKNSFSGEFPKSLGNCSGLSQLVLGFNAISGSIPASLFHARNLTYLDLQYNNLTGTIPPEIGNATMMTRLLLNNNQLTGDIPAVSMGNLALLQGVNMELNHFTGSIPDQFSNCTKLIVLSAYRNLLQGSIPFSFGQLAKLEHLILDNNMLSGAIPASLSNCTKFTNISFNNNFLEGTIMAVASLPNMLYFDVSFNRLSGTIPPSLQVMNQLQTLDISHNSFSGEIPSSLSGCVSLVSMNLSSNNLTGAIPISLWHSLQILIALNLSHNYLSGAIPQELGYLTNVEVLDLCYNNLSSSIPASLQNISRLSEMNFSYNQLVGAVPTQGPFANLTAISFLGNPGLCGPILQKPCPKTSHHHGLSKAAVIGMALGIFVAAILLMLYCLWCFRRSNFSVKPTSHQMVFRSGTTASLRLTLEDILKATNNFSEENIIGRGGAAVVYKGTLPDGRVLAFKKLTLPESSNVRSATAELKSLENIKHRNLVTLLGYFYDQKHDILFFDFMPNGSLDNHLHPDFIAHRHTDDFDSIPQALSLEARLRIAKDVAYGLAYLHHECPTIIVHCDIKPGNVLLDNDMVARISDFGLARILMETRTISTTQVMRGTLGYVAPESASSGQISRKSDVYSYGVMLMEMVSLKKPTGAEFVEGGSHIVAWAREMVVKGSAGVEEQLGVRGRKEVAQIERILKVAVMCTDEDPRRRPTMKEVAEWLPSSDATQSPPPLPSVWALAADP